MTLLFTLSEILAGMILLLQEYEIMVQNYGQTRQNMRQSVVKSVKCRVTLIPEDIYHLGLYDV
jgi:hypothetical protein